MTLRLRALAEQLRGSLFYLPTLFVVAAAVLAWAVIGVDLDAGEDGKLPLLLSVTVASARSILSTIAGATITVAGIVFSVTVVSVQLASSQFSPRVLRGFLRDRFQQSIIGLVVGTFTYCLFVLAATRISGDGEATASPSLSVTIAIVLAVASMLGIIAFIDHSARAAQVGEIIQRVTRETLGRIDALYRPTADTDPTVTLPDSAPPVGAQRRVLRAWTDGWIQQLHAPGLLTSAPPGTYLRLDARVGSYVVKHTPLVTYWAHDDGRLDQERVREAFVIGSGRTMQQDVHFGLRQLIDIGLRALSTGINDPTTAAEVIVHLGSVLADLLQRELPPRVVPGEDGRLLVTPDAPAHGDYVDQAFDQLRVAAAGEPSVLIEMLGTIVQLDEVLAAAGLSHRASALRRHAELILATAEHTDLMADDRERIRAAAAPILHPDGPAPAPTEGH